MSSCYHMRRVEFIFRHCYSNNYSLSFDDCFAFEPESNHEIRSLELVRELFRGTNAGDINEIGIRMAKKHILYCDSSHVFSNSS